MGAPKRARASEEQLDAKLTNTNSKVAAKKIKVAKSSSSTDLATPPTSANIN